jgi:hypothetical protein
MRSINSTQIYVPTVFFLIARVFCPGFVHGCASRSLEAGAGANAGNKTAGVKPAALSLFVRFEI